MPPNGSTIDRASLASAKREAAKTGLPQPVRSRAGAVVYYVDYSGAVVPAVIAQDTIQRHEQSVKAAQDAARHVGHDLYGKEVPLHTDGTVFTPAEQQQLTASQQQAAAANQQMGYVWVDGKPMKVTAVNKDGSYNVTIGKSKSQPLSDLPLGTSAFGALDAGGNSSLDPTTRFTMAYGSADIFTGGTNQNNLGTLPNYGTHSPGALNPASAGEFDASTRQVGNSTNMMTVGSGLTWLVNLALKDPASYQALLSKLHDATYLSDADYARATGGYDSAAGQAFARAAIDTAVINGQPDGLHVSLFDLLDQKATAAKAATANAYKPVERDYADPAAIEGAARSQAQSDLGRDLTAAEVQQLVGHFHGLQDQEYDQVDAAGRAGTNAKVTTPNVAGQVDTFIHDGANAQEAASWHVAQYGQALHALFGGGR